MLTLDSLNADKSISVFLSIQFAEKALPIWEKEYPKDTRPRRAIEAAKAWLSNPGKDAAYAWAAAHADAAAYAAWAANADAAAWTAWAAAAAYAAAWTAWAAVDTYAADIAASRASRGLSVDKESLVQEVILESLDWILQHKIESRQSFANPELIFNYLTEGQKQSFLFNLDAVA